MCPYKRAVVLSEGSVCDDMKSNKLWVSCLYHKPNYELNDEDTGKCSNHESVDIATGLRFYPLSNCNTKEQTR